MKKAEMKRKDKGFLEKEYNNTLIELLLQLNRLSGFFKDPYESILRQVKNLGTIKSQESLFEYLQKSQESFFEYLRRQEEEIEERYNNDILRSMGMALCLGLDSTRLRSKLGFLITIKEDALFNLIRKEGPIILCNPDVQNKLEAWLSDKNNAQSKMNALTDSLLKYANLDRKTARFRDGRPKIDPIKKLGASVVRVYHKRITLALKTLKRYAKKQQENIENDKDWDEFIIVYLLKLMGSFRKRWEIITKKYDSSTKLDKMNIDDVNFIRGTRFIVLKIASLLIIQTDQDLRSRFLEFNWEPHDFAKELLAKSFNASKSTIHKLLYSKEGKAKLKLLAI